MWCGVSRWDLAAGWVVVIGLAGWYSNVGPSNPGPERTEAKLRQLAASTDTPIYYLGSSFHGEDLEYAAVLSGNGEVVGDDTLDPGQGLLLVYGEKCSQRTCAAKIALSIEPWASDLTHGSRQLGSLRGVPAVSTSEAVILVTGDILVRVGGGPGATELAGDAAKALRLVGEAEAAERDLPPPSETLARRLASLC